jgi:tetratricopeptide (TPR) repeat protein
VISAVEQQAWFEGKTPAAVWQARKRKEALDEEFLRGFETGDSDDEDSEDADEDAEIDEELDQIVEAMLRDAGIDPLSEEAQEFRDMARRKHHEARSKQRAGESAEAKEIYRRLVQRLHPDRGGDWSHKREALWHEVQRAWHAQDVDWLSRLEAEIEIATETLDAKSPVGRLHAALKELESARRDTERKLRRYRREPAWHFTQTKRTKDDVARLAATLREERDYLLRALASLEATIAHWEKPLGQARAKQQGQRVVESALAALRRGR